MAPPRMGGEAVAHPRPPAGPPGGPLTIVERIVARIATSNRPRVHILIVESTGVTWRAPAHISREQLQAAAARRLVRIQGLTP